MSALLYVIPCLLVSVLAGYFLGSNTRTNKERQEAHRSREATLKVLASVLGTTEQLSTDVNHYNSDLRDVGQTLTDLQVDGDLIGMQQALLTQVTAVLESNRRLEDDLECAKMRVQEQSEEIDRARKEARTDPLSGVGNRIAFDEKLQYRLAVWRRQQQPFVLVLADVDHFKWINDSHGHQAGDLVIERLGGLLRGCLRENDFVARYGGDEFAWILADVDLDKGTELTERIRTLVSQRNFDPGEGAEKISATLSVGVAAVWDGATPEEILSRADLALYRSKHSGRNTVHAWVADNTFVPAAQLAVTGA